MKAKLGKILQLTAVAVLFFGSYSSNATDIREYNLRFALQSAKGSAQVMGAERFADIVREKSGGKINIKVFEGGQLGTDASSLTAMQAGTIHFSLMSSGTLAGHDKGFVLFDIPFLFNTEKEADACADGPIGQKLKARLPPKGLRVLAFAELGFRHIHNSKGPIITIEDLKNLKIRVIPLPMYLEFINGTGANAVPLPFTELYTALEQKAVDGATNPFDNIASAKFYEVNHYLSLSRHMYSMMAFLMSNKTWEQMNPAEQKIIQDAADEARLYERKVAREKAASDFEFLKTKMEVNQIPASEIDKMRAVAKIVIAKWTPEIGPDLVAEINAQLAKMRSGK